MITFVQILGTIVVAGLVWFLVLPALEGAFGSMALMKV
jgi:hypothetical protein